MSSTTPEHQDESPEKSAEDRFETKCGVTLAVFASILAIMDLGGGNADYCERYAQAEKANAYAWYQSKGIKESLIEGQRDTLASLLDAGVIGKDHGDATRSYIANLDGKIAKYRKQKDEILKGSDAVGKENWAQDTDGQLGQVYGADQWAAEMDAYESVGNIFDSANLSLQICLVIGAISIIVHTPKWRTFLYRGAFGLGLVGTLVGIAGYIEYFRV